MFVKYLKRNREKEREGEGEKEGEESFWQRTYKMKNFVQMKIIEIIDIDK